MNCCAGVRGGETREGEQRQSKADVCNRGSQGEIQERRKEERREEKEEEEDDHTPGRRFLLSRSNLLCKMLSLHPGKINLENFIQ